MEAHRIQVQSPLQGALVLEQRLPFRFTGSAGEYFRIWIVNAVLTIFSLGLYLPWAKVRTRRYFYANTLLDDQPFDYLAKPGMLLRGYLIVGAAVILIEAAKRFLPAVGSILSLAGVSLVPLLLCKAHRFRARNIGYRNLRFRFLGTVGGAYRAYAFYPLAAVAGFAVTVPWLFAGPGAGRQPGALAPALAAAAALVGIALAAAFPYFVFLQRRYAHDSFCYGRTPAYFSGRIGPFYGFYGLAALMSIGLMVVGGAVIGVSGYLLTRGPGGGHGAGTGMGMIPMMLLTYLALGLPLLLIQQYVQARTLNYAWRETRLGPVRVDLQLEAHALVWIRLTNILAILCSLGLLVPWAKVRRTRYMLSRATVLARGDLDAFRAGAAQEEDALGDTAADFFDWDIGW